MEAGEAERNREYHHLGRHGDDGFVCLVRVQIGLFEHVWVVDHLRKATGAGRTRRKGGQASPQARMQDTEKLIPRARSLALSLSQRSPSTQHDACFADGPWAPSYVPRLRLLLPQFQAQLHQHTFLSCMSRFMSCLLVLDAWGCASPCGKAPDASPPSTASALSAVPSGDDLSAEDR